MNPTISLPGIVLSLVVLHRESEDKLAKQAEEKVQEKARQAGELVEDVEEKLGEVVNDRMDKLETASAEVLELEEGTPESLGVMVAKVAVVSAIILGAKAPLITALSSHEHSPVFARHVRWECNQGYVLSCTIVCRIAYSVLGCDGPRLPLLRYLRLSASTLHHS